MCLYSYRKRPMYAKRDLLVYKIVQMRTLNGLRGMRSPYTGYLLFRGLNESVERANKIYYFNQKYMVSKGYIHAYTSKSAAEKELRHLEWSRDEYNFAIKVAYIPKGTAYYLGEIETMDICAKRMVILGNEKCVSAQKKIKELADVRYKM